MADRRDRLTGMTDAAAQYAPTERLMPATVRVPRPARKQVLLYAPPPAPAAAYVTILESEGVDVLVANGPDNAAVLLDNASPALIFALVPVLGEDLRELFRKRAPNAEVRIIPGLVQMLQDAVAPPREAFDFAIRAIVATAGVLSAARSTPRGRTARILTWAEEAARSLNLSSSDLAQVKLAAALYDVPSTLSSIGEVDSSAYAPTRKRDRALHRAMLAEFMAGLDSPFGVPDSEPGTAEQPATPLDLVEAAAQYAILIEGRAVDPALILRKMATGGDVHPMAAEAVIGAAGGHQAARDRRILIIDPDATARNVLALRLTNEGYETDMAADGRTALEAIRREPPSLIVSEVVLPGMDGFALLDTIRREGYAKVPFVFLSSRSDPASTNKGLLLGAVDFLAKPTNIEVLLTKLQKLLGQQIAASEAAGRISLADIGTGTATEMETISYAELRPGVSIMNRFRLLADLGEGGMGKVFKARDERLEEDVVVKVMKTTLAGDERTLNHFKREIRLARRISHPAVVRLFDFWEAGPLKFVTMEFLQGTDLAGEIRRRGPFPVPIAVRLARELFEGLGAAHDLGVVHRDIKPHNVFLMSGGHLKILDFGIAQGLDATGPDAATQTQSIIGTPDYMSPEQLLGQQLDPRTDLYSAGVLLHELLTGGLPFHGPTRAESVTARLHRVAEPPSATNANVPPQVDAIVMKLLARNREMRYPDAQTVAAELAALRM